MKLNDQDQSPFTCRYRKAWRMLFLPGPSRRNADTIHDRIVPSFPDQPATAGKGVNTLVDEGFCYKKRGIGIFVKEGARDMLKKNVRLLLRRTTCSL